MNKKIKESVKIKLNLRERNNTVFRDIFNEFTDKNDSKVIKFLNKNTKLVKSTTATECPICLEKISRDSIVRETNCNHIFHANCIDRWFEVSCKCPLCNNEFN